MKPDNKKTAKRKLGKSETSLTDYLVFFAFFGYLTIVSPVLHSKQVLDISLLPRLYALGTFLLAMTPVFYFLKYFHERRNMVFTSVPFILMAVYIGVIGVSARFAHLPEEGFFELTKNAAFLILMSYAAILFLRHPDWATRIAPLFGIAGMIAFFLALEQYSEKVLTNTTGRTDDGREAIYAVDGLMSHKNELSTFFMMTMPLLVYGLYRMRNLGQWFCGLALIAVTAMIILLKTRAVWLGVSSGIMLGVVMIVLFTRRIGFPIIWRYILGAGLIIGIAGLVTVVKVLPKSQDEFSAVGRIQSIFDPTSDSNIHRINMWGSTVRMIKDNFWLGVGPGNWRVSYYPFIEGIFDTENQVNWARPHNDFLWVFSEKGFVGILLYSAFFASIFFMALRVFLRAPERHQAILSLCLASGILAFMMVGNFSFPSERIDHQINLAIFCAGIISLYYQYGRKATTSKLPSWILPTVFIPILMFIVYYGHTCVEQEKHLRKVNNALAREDFETMIKEAELSRNPLRTIDNISNPPDSYIAFACYKLKRLDDGLAAIDKALDDFPNNPKLLQYKALFLYEKGRYEEAQEFIQKVLKVLPRSEQNLANSAAAFYKMGQFQNAIDTETRIPDWENKPTVVQRVNYLKELVKKEGPVGKPPIDAPAVQ